MARKYVIPVRFDENQLAMLDKLIHLWQDEHPGMSLSRSSFLRLTMQFWQTETDKRLARKRKGKYPCSSCGKKLLPAQHAYKVTDLFGQEIYTCPQCAAEKSLV